jgi:hypothetical protein
LQVPPVPVLEQAVPGSVHAGSVVVAGQQGSVVLPQPQRPLWHMPNGIVAFEVVQLSPSAVQRPLKQQALPSHRLPGQHGSPGWPQRWHVPVVADVDEQVNPSTQTGVALLAPSGGQHVSPGPPQLEHRLPRHDRFDR